LDSVKAFESSPISVREGIDSTYAASFPGLMEAINVGPSAVFSWLTHYYGTADAVLRAFEPGLSRPSEDQSRHAGTRVDWNRTG
jgi:hypothetical protein